MLLVLHPYPVPIKKTMFLLSLQILITLHIQVCRLCLPLRCFLSDMWRRQPLNGPNLSSFPPSLLDSNFGGKNGLVTRSVPSLGHAAIVAPASGVHHPLTALSSSPSHPATQTMRLPAARPRSQRHRRRRSWSRGISVVA